MPADWVLWLLLVTVPVVGTDDKPVEMTSSGGLSVDLKRHVGIAKKDVVIRREDVTVCCDEAEAEYSGNQIERVTCRGRVVIVRPDGTQATAELAVFEAARDHLTLSGNAEVQTKDARLSGDKIIYDIKKDQLEVAGKKSKFHFEPKKLGAPAPARACPPGSA